MVVISRHQPSVIEIYDARERAYISAMHAIRNSRYDFEIRVHFLSLMDNHLGKSTCGSIARDILSYRRVARFFQRRARINE